MTLVARGLMNTAHPPDILAERHYLTLVVRLVVDEQGVPVNGELTDVASADSERFVGLAGLYGSLNDWLNQHLRPGRESQLPQCRIGR